MKTITHQTKDQVNGEFPPVEGFVSRTIVISGDSAMQVVVYKSSTKVGAIIAAHARNNECNCSHDCCGHWFYHRPRILKGRHVNVFVQRGYRNV